MMSHIVTVTFKDKGSAVSLARRLSGLFGQGPKAFAAVTLDLDMPESRQKLGPRHPRSDTKALDEFKKALRGSGLAVKPAPLRFRKSGPLLLYATSRKLYPFGVRVVGTLNFIQGEARVILEQGLGRAGLGGRLS